MQYQVLAAHTIRELNEIINDALNKGWVCQGGVSVGYNNNGFVDKQLIYVQAMIKQD